MSFAILRVEKLSSWGNVAGSGAHTYRVDGLAPNADPVRKNLNATLVGTPQATLFDVKERVKAVTETPRKNGVLCLELFLGASPEWWHGKSEKQIEEWSKTNIDWLKNHYGAANVVHAVLHRDETSPHIVAYVVPELDGKLNARGLVGGRAALSALQTNYATAMQPFGLERGIPGSKAKHNPVKRFYGNINRAAATMERHVDRLAKPVPPVIPLTASRKAKEAILEDWTVEDTKRTSKLTVAASGALLAAHQAKEQVHQLKLANSALTAENDRLKDDLQKAYEELGLDNDQVGRLRKADVSLVAQLLGHMGQVKPKENALDLVMRVGQFSFGQAVAWLHNELGPEQAGMAVEEAVRVAKPERPFTPAENEIKRAVVKQTDALGCDKYRLTLVSKREDVKPFLPGKTPGKDGEKFYSREELINLIPWLRYKNNQGDHVIITPMDDHAFYVLLDDARVSFEQLEAGGFAPCLVQKSSWESQQIVFKVPRDLDRKQVISFFNQFNRAAGDEDITGLRHGFRMAGFRNVKPKHERAGQYPFVEVLHAINRFCTKSVDLIQQLAGRERGAALPVEVLPFR